MTLASRLATAALALPLTMAGPASAGELDSRHTELADAVESTGVTLYINPTEVCDQEDAPMGLYSGTHKVMVVCQDNRVAGSEKVVRWTSNDLDTLRHETQHLIQDCVDGSLDGELDAVYREPVALAHEVLGVRGIRSIVRVYDEAPDHVILLELEAFSVAAMDDTTEQVADVARYCF